MDLPGRALLPGLRITYDLAFDRVCHHGRLLRLGGESYRAGHAPVSGEVGVDG